MSASPVYNLIGKKERILEENQEEVERLSEALQDDLIDMIHFTLRNDDINFTENLSESFFKTESDDGFKAIVTDNKYAYFVEYGMPAGQHVSWDKLFNWVQGKLGLNAQEAKDVTWKIYHKIKARGIKPTRFIKKSIIHVIGKRGMIVMKSVPSSMVKGLKKRKPSKVSRFLKKIFKVVKTVTRYKYRKKHGDKPVKTPKYINTGKKR